MTGLDWPELPPSRLVPARPDLDPEVLAGAARLVRAVREEGETALRAAAERFGDLRPGDPLVLPPEALRAAHEALPEEDRLVLERTAARIRAFAEEQRRCLVDLEARRPWGALGHTVLPLESAGCYAPGGRFPLPSSVLMTAVTARVAGVERVWVASPRPAPLTLAAAHVAGADAILAVGGAQAVAALAYGAGPVPAADVVVGPGNAWVTAAKKLVAGEVRIDGLAGPSELVVVADASADPSLVAADLIAQAEHDPQARPILVSLDPDLPAAVRSEVAGSLAGLATADVARRAFSGGAITVVADRSEALTVCDRLAPEHLQLSVVDADDWRPHLRHYGGLFLGESAGEVLGDYGAGPNHVLPTGGTATARGGLSVFDFLKVSTWMRVDDPAAAADLARDAERLATGEGLVGHARAAGARLARARGVSGVPGT